MINNPTIKQVKNVLKLLLNRADFNIDEFGGNGRTQFKNLKQICESKNEYRILFQSKFYQQLIKGLVKDDQEYAEHLYRNLEFNGLELIIDTKDYIFKCRAINPMVIEIIKNGDPDQFSLLNKYKIEDVEKRQLVPQI